MSGLTFHATQPVLFEHVDAAGWVFYPRYALFVNAAVERAFAEGLGWPFHRMHLEEHLGVPTVDLQMRFHRPSRLGEELTLSLRVEAVGRSSATLAVDMRVAGEDEARVDARVVLVHVALGDPPKTRPWPDPIAAKLRGEAA